MPTLYVASLGFLRRHPWQLALALLGICIGVAVMVAVDLANESSRKAFTQSMDALNGQATHHIVGGPGGLNERVYTDLRVQHGVRAIAPIVTGYVTIGNEVVQLLGVDVFAERDFRAYTSPADLGADLAGQASNDTATPEELVRQFLTGSGSVLLSGDLAHRLGIGSGDPFSVIADGKTRSASLTGFIGGDQPLTNTLIADIAVAQTWLGMPGRLSRIDVRLGGDGASSTDSISALLPRDARLLSASGRTQTTADMSNAFMTNLMAMSLLAMLVGIFLIYNSVAFAVLQRRDLIGILRAIGVTRRQTAALILAEATVLGMVGAGVGVGLGVWLGEQLVILVARTVSDHYFLVNVTNVSLSGLSLFKGLVAGMGATLLAAAVPAWEAASYPPRLAMTRSSIEVKAGAAVRWLAIGGAALTVLAVLIVLVSGRSLAAGLVALFILILGFALCIPFLVRLVTHGCEELAGRVAGTSGRLAVGGIARSLSRTGVAIVALAVAVSATIGVSVMVNSFRDSVNDWLGNTLQSDVYVGVPRGTLEPGLVADLTALPAVREFTTSRRAWLEMPDGRVRIIAIRMAPESYAGTRIRGGDAETAWAAFEDDGGVLVSDAYAWRNNVDRGDSLTVAAAAGPVFLPIVGVYQSYDSNDGAVMMSRSTYDRLFDDPGIDSIGVFLEPGTDPDAVMDQFRELAEGRQALIMNSNARIRELSLGIFDRTFVITNVLYWLAVGVAVIGILGAMLALQLERAREFGVLRALGMTPGQTGRLVSMQTAVIGLFAGIAAVPLGLVMAWILISVINRRAFGWQIEMSLSAAPLLSAIALAIMAALIAGIYPAWHAAGRRPALAMREE
jgi:putative ABC transport system permease protein